MVGVQTSNRCDVCRKRKKKVMSSAQMLAPYGSATNSRESSLTCLQCSGQKPSCSECINAGWGCPGYKTKWRFIHETSKLAEHYAGRKFVYDTVGESPDGANPIDATNDIRLPNELVVWENARTSQNAYRRLAQRPVSTNLNIPQTLNMSPLSSSLVYCLDSKVDKTLIPLRLIGSFFDFIPSRIGYNKALDDAVSCLCTMYRSAPTTVVSSPKATYQSYAKALASLRWCLSDPASCLEPETLCASILLQMCEVSI